MLNHLILVSISNLVPAYSISDERSAMTRNCAISLPQHPPGPPSITQTSDATDTMFSVSKVPLHTATDHHRSSLPQLTDRAPLYTTAICLIPLYHHQRPLARFRRS